MNMGFKPVNEYCYPDHKIFAHDNGAEIEETVLSEDDFITRIAVRDKWGYTLFDSIIEGDFTDDERKQYLEALRVAAQEPVFKNLTPHVLNVRDAEGKMHALPPEQQPARARLGVTPRGTLGGFTVRRTVIEEGPELPDPQPHVYLIVSRIAAQAVDTAVRTLDDLLVPGEAIRDTEGKIIGCDGFVEVTPANG